MPAKRVLIVDDDSIARLFVQAVMENAGWQTLEGFDGREAVELAESEQPDLIILDIAMPVMDGLEAFQTLRKTTSTAHIPIIMLTGINEDSETRYTPESMESVFGVERPEGFVDKPVDADFLLNSVMGIMG